MKINSNYQTSNITLNHIQEQSLDIKDFYGKWEGRLGNEWVKVTIKENGSGMIGFICNGIMGFGSDESKFSNHNGSPTLKVNHALYPERGYGMLGNMGLTGKLLSKTEMEVSAFHFWLFDRHTGGTGTLRKVE